MIISVGIGTARTCNVLQECGDPGLPIPGLETRDYRRRLRRRCQGVLIPPEGFSNACSLLSDSR